MSDRDYFKARKVFWKLKTAEQERLEELDALWAGVPDRVPLVPYKRVKSGGVWL